MRFDGYQYDARYKIKQGLKYAGRQMEKQQSAERKETSAGLFCKFCGNPMPLKSAEASLKPDHDLITYECIKCGHSMCREVRYR